LTRAEAKAGNDLCRLAALAAREFGTEIAFGGAAPGEESVLVTIAINGTDARVFVPPAMIHRAARSFFGLAKDHAMPESLAAAALEASLEPLIARLEKAAGIEIAVRGIAVAGHEAAGTAPFTFRLPGLPEGGTIAIRPSADLAMPKLPATAWTTGDALTLSVPMVVAEVGVTVAELGHLSTGDVIVLPGMTAANVAHVQLAISPHTVIIAEVDGHRLTVARSGKSMSNTDAASGAKGAPAAKPATPAAKPAAAAPAAPAAPEPVVPAATVEELPLSIVFDLGTVELSLAELKALVPGQVIDLAREPGNAVRVTVNGRRIGAGEIVEIEGRLGVRITELAVRNERPAS
jgi:type III secretion system YscQ/HrcQ family protein